MKVSDNCVVYRLEWSDDRGVEYAMETDSIAAFVKVRDHISRMEYTEKNVSYIEQCTVQYVKAPNAE